MNKGIVYIIFILIGLILGFILSDWQNKDNVIVKTVTKVETNTVYSHSIDTIFLSSKEIIQEIIRDTVLIKEFKPQIKAFRASKPFLHGNVYVSGEVLGEVIKIDVTNDFKIPSITNTITTNNTEIKKPSGLFLTAGVNSNFQTPYVGAIFVKDKYLVGLNTSGFQFGYKLGRR